MKTTLAGRWALAHDTVAWLRTWQPELDEAWPCVLVGAEAVAHGREAEPAVLWDWTQADQRFQALMTVLNLLVVADYGEMLTPPDSPSADDWLGVVALTVYEPHGRPEGAPEGTVWVWDNLLL